VILRDDESKRRVRSVLAAAARLADPSDPIGREARSRLPAATGLSPEGVDLGLSRHVETAVSDQDLALLVARAGRAPHVHVVLSANVFVGAVRALAIAVATAPRVSVRSSRREDVMAPLLVRALVEAEGPFIGVQIVDAVQPLPGDELHVYGRRESIRALTEAAPAGVLVRGHGPGMGIAVLDAEDPADGWTDGGIARAAALLSWDVAAFDQRGCLSPRIVIFRGPVRLVRAFCESVASELGARNREVPRGRLDEAERSSGRLYCETMRAVGNCLEGDSCAIGFDPSARQLLLPPTGRHLHVACVSEPGAVTNLIQPFRAAITSVGVLGRGPAVRAAMALAPFARTPMLGAMQRPALDGPVDLREVKMTPQSV
jgi:hypothetical protein